MEGATAPKAAQKRRKTWQEFSKKKRNEHRILNAEPISPEFLAAAIRELTTKSSPSSVILAITVIVATIAAIFPPVAGNLVNSATSTDSGNFTTTSRKLIKAPVKCRTSELQSIAVFRDYHANHGRVSHGVRD
jgi:hypothetical protein